MRTKPFRTDTDDETEDDTEDEMRRDNFYVRLSSVCDRFYEVVRDKRFRRIIKRTLKGLSHVTSSLNISQC